MKPKKGAEYKAANDQIVLITHVGAQGTSPARTKFEGIIKNLPKLSHRISYEENGNAIHLETRGRLSDEQIELLQDAFEQGQLNLDPDDLGYVSYDAALKIIKELS